MMCGALLQCYLRMVFVIFVIFMDAHTNFIWFYPLVLKFDVFNVFHQFQVFVERQFSRKIKFIQTDWVLNIVN